MSLSKCYVCNSLLFLALIAVVIHHWSHRRAVALEEFVWPGSGVHDAGILIVDGHETGTLTHSFRIINRSKGVRRLRLISKSCSCTEASLSSSDVPPGKGVELRLTADISRRRGHELFSCTLESDDRVTASFALEAEIHSFIEPDPPHLDLGNIVVGTSPVKRTSLAIYAPAGTALPPLGFSTGGDDRLSFTYTSESCILERHKAYTKCTIPLDVAVRTDRDPSHEFARSELRLIDNRSKKALYSLPVSWKVVAPIAVRPSRLLMRLNPTKGIHSVTRSLMVRRSDGKPLKVGKIASTGDSFRLSIEKLDNWSSKIEITVDDSRLVGAILNGYVTILTKPDDVDSGRVLEVVVPVTVLTEKPAS